MSKGIKVILVISIALNVLILGIIIGHFSKRAEYWGRSRPVMNKTLGTLPEEKKDMIISAMRKLRRSTQDTKQELDRTRIELLETLTAQKFNREKFEDEVKKLHGLHGELAFDMAGTISALAENLNQQERIALSEFIEEMREQRRPRGPAGGRPYGPGFDAPRPGRPGPDGPPDRPRPPGPPQDEVF